jgi:archaellum component FlaG (FlaF/FlaG flagellin family)
MDTSKQAAEADSAKVTTTIVLGETSASNTEVNQIAPNIHTDVAEINDPEKVNILSDCGQSHYSTKFCY